MPLLPLEPSGTPSPTSGGTADMLPAERARATFDSAALARLMRGNRVDTIEQYSHLFNAPPFNDRDQDIFLSYEEMWSRAMDRHVEAMKIVRSNPDFRAAHQSLKVSMGSMLQGASADLAIHFTMFLAQIQTQTTDEQRKAWLPGALKANYWGVYAQTELGHGSNLRALETTATYDKRTQEFIIDSPTLSSMKWWPTGMYAATHGAVMARLIIDGRDYGFHGFMLQFRDDQGFLMPGVEVGEIGPKLNRFNANIGYARFDRVRIPLFNMFAKRQQVLPDGTYVPSPPKLSRFKYISMMQTRNMFVSASYRALARSATILVRYSCVRRQGFKDSTAGQNESVAGGEHVVMDYSNQQYRAFRAIGMAYLFHWSSKYTTTYLRRVQQRVEEGRETAGEELNELHITLCGLKVSSSVHAHNQLEECRRDCGGQGFLMASGVSDAGASFGVVSTGEGDRTILSLQVARFLIKAAGLVKVGRESELVGSVMYLKDPPPAALPPTDFAGCSDQLVWLLRSRAAMLARELEEDFSAARARGLGFDEAMNAIAVQGFKASDAHSWYIMADSTQCSLAQNVKDPAILEALSNLFELTLLQHVHENLGDWMGILFAEHRRLMLQRIIKLLAIIRPNAVALTDGFGFFDSELKSTLGGRDGNVYEAIYDAARRSPLNRSRKMIGWDKFATQLDLDFLRQGMRTQHSESTSSSKL